MKRSSSSKRRRTAQLKLLNDGRNLPNPRSAIESLEARHLLSAAYGVTLIGNPGVTTTPEVMNDHGEVAGYYVAANGHEHAFTYANGHFNDLGTLGGQTVSVRAINNAGQIAGEIAIDSSGNTEPFLYAGGHLVLLGTPGVTLGQVVAMNSSGQIAGNLQLAQGQVHGFIYSNGKLTDLGTLGGPDTRVAAMNDSGAIVGYSNTGDLIPTSPNYVRHAFVYSNGKMNDLGTFGGQTSQAFGINNAGTVVGYADSALARQSFKTVNGKIVNLNAGIGGDAFSINDSGQIVGDLYQTSSDSEQLYFYDKGKVHDLRSLNFYSASINSMGWFVIANLTQAPLVYRGGTLYDLAATIDPQTLAPASIATNLGDNLGAVYPPINSSGQTLGQSTDGRGLLFTPATTGAISGKVFNDADANGVQNKGEAGLAGIKVYQDINNAGSYQDGDPATTTNASGQYTFNDLPPGPYTIRFIAPNTSWRQSVQKITLPSGGHVTGRNFATLPLYSYAVTDLGTLGGDSSYATGINNAGQIIGQAATASNDGHAFLYSPVTGKMTDLGTFGGIDSSATAINDAGQVVGSAASTVKDVDGNVLRYAFLYSNGHLANLGSVTTESSYATGLNINGQVIGYSLLTMPIDQYQITGDEAFVYSGGKLTAIQPPASAYFSNSYPLSINNAGKVTGYFYFPPFKGEPGSYQLFKETGGVVTLVGAVTNGPPLLPAPAGPTVGSLEVGDFVDHAYLFAQSQAIDLNDTIPANSHWTLTTAVAINNSNQIVGQGTNPTGQTHAFLLTPVLGSISGRLFNDLNGDGKQQSLEGGLKGWTVYADVKGTGVYSPGDPTAASDAAGHYSLTGLAAGGYVVRVVQKAGYRPTAPSAFAETVVGAGKSVSGPAFGEVAIGPYSGSPAPFGLIQAENYDLGGQGAGYANPGNQNRGGLYRPAEGVGIGAIPIASGGGYFLGWTQPGEVVNYTVTVAANGTYTFNFRVAAAITGDSFHLNVDGVDVTGTLAVPNTGDWNTYTLVSKKGVHLTADKHVLQLAFDAQGLNGGSGNFDWIQAVKT